MDLAFFLTMVVVFVTYTAIGRWWWAQGDNAASSAHAFARKVDLALADRTEEVVTARLVRRERAAVFGGCLGALAAAALAAARTDEAASGYRLFGVMLCFLAGRALGFGVVAWRESVSRAADGPRLARATVPTHGDYVARHERVSAWAVAVLAFLGAGALLVVERTNGFDDALHGAVPVGLALAVLVVPGLTIAVDEVLARRLLARPQVASTTLELAWDDALRARALRDMVTVPLSAGLFGLLALIGLVGDRVEGTWPEEPAGGIMVGASVLLLVGAAVMAVVSAVLRPERHVRRRLWPTPPGQAVQPPAPLPTWGSAR